MSDYYRRILIAETECDVWALHRSIEMAIQINAEPIAIEMRAQQADLPSEFNIVSSLETCAQGGCLSQFYHYGHATVQLFTASEGTRFKNRGKVKLQFVSSTKASVPTDRTVDQLKSVFPQLQEAVSWRPRRIEELRQEPGPE